jgi:hypothetical protein
MLFFEVWLAKCLCSACLRHTVWSALCPVDLHTHAHTDTHRHTHTHTCTHTHAHTHTCTHTHTRVNSSAVIMMLYPPPTSFQFNSIQSDSVYFSSIQSNSLSFSFSHSSKQCCWKVRIKLQGLGLYAVLFARARTTCLSLHAKCHQGVNGTDRKFKEPRSRPLPVLS